MREKNGMTMAVSLIIAAIFLVPLSAVEKEIGLITNETVNEETPTTYLNGGWLEERDGVKIVHISGSYYDMGYQYGSLLKNEIQQNFRAYLSYLEHAGVTYDDLLDIWNVMKDNIPQIYLDEFQGRADGSGLSFDDIGTVLSIEVVNHDISACCGAVAWDSATADGKLYHMQSVDWPLNIVDPETGTYLQENQALVIRQPEGGYASISVLIDGQVASWGGVNEQGIRLSQTVSWCMADISNHGMPIGIRQQMTLDHAATAEEAIDILNTNGMRGWTILLSDYKIPVAYILELSATHSYIGTWDDPAESTSPFYAIDHVVRRGNFFVDPTMASLQREIYNPRSALHWIMHGYVAKALGLYDDYTYEYYPEVMHYKLLSELLEENLGSLDLNTSLSMLRDHYGGKTSPVWNMWQNTFGWYRDVYYQTVICPETGDITVSFADAELSAYENTVHYFNMYDLFEAQPP